MMNKADPRVDSNYDHRANPHSAVPGQGSTTSSTTTAGPHSSNMMNKVDPRVDSDFDHRANPNSNVPGYGSGTSGYGTAGHGTAGHGTSGYSTAGHGTTGHGTSGYGTTSTTTSGPHNSNIANKADPRVDSDRDHRNDPTSHVGGYGTQGTSGTMSTGAGSGVPGHGTGAFTESKRVHDSTLLNKLDPGTKTDAHGRAI
ncbi:hypothetical protein CLCR_09108 [Cladophialophora carrionii]|uniref:Period circadian protein n=1 Tax=Cladophialophora carrionii TaxID=86049 RepID=A0A1C1CU34_9EURO|nr:hypothetical protein CLCR_09108 [Cladophialophora carrionii]